MNAKISKKRVAILGGEGFIGRNISDVISDFFDCFSLGVKKSLFLKRKDSYIQANPYTDVIEDYFDVYVHLIDNQIESGSFEVAEKKMMHNLDIDRGKHLIIFSSAVVYANPGSPYGKRKIALENFYEKFCNKNGINLTIFRLFNIYGKYHIPFKQGGLIANILYNYVNNKPIEINDMDAKRDFIYAKDMGEIVKWTIENNFYGKMDLATGKLVSIRDLLDVLQERVFLRIPEVINKESKETSMCPMGDGKMYAKIRPTTLEQGLRETLGFFEKNMEIINKYLNL